MNRSLLERWTRTVLRFRAGIVVAWVAILGAGAWSSLALPGLLSNTFIVPKSESARAQAILGQRFGDRPDGTFTVVFKVANPQDKGVQASVARRLARAARTIPTGEAGDVRTEGSGVLFADVASRLRLEDAKRYTDELRRALRGSPRAFVTGPPAIQHDIDPIFDGDRRRGELFAIPVALVVVVIVLGFSLAALVPFAFAACTIGATFAIVWAVAHVVSPVTYVTNLVELIGLGLAVDYSLFIVSRFREELERFDNPDDAIVRTIATAGRAIVFSGAAVAIGLALLLFVPVPFIRSMGIAGLVIPFVSIAAALTLQPVLLSLIGRRARGHGWQDRRVLWSRLAASIMSRPKLLAAAGFAVLGLATVPVFFIQITPGALAGLPREIESMRGYYLMRDNVGPGVITPIHVVVDTGVEGGARTPAVKQALDRLSDELVTDGEAYVIATGSEDPYVDPTGRFSQIYVVGRHEYGAKETRDLVRRLRGRHIPAADFPTGMTVVVGGEPAVGYDFLERTYGAFPWLVLAALVLTAVILLRAFRSLLVPLKAVLLNVMTIAAVYGLLVLVFQWGAGQDIEGWIPIFLFAVLFGLSMDYEVFIVSRMREAWDELPDNELAVTRGLVQTGRVVTAAALVMVVAFSGFIIGRIDALQQFGFGLAAAVLIDATLVRMILVPSVMAIMGRWNWWLPHRIARLVRVRS